MSGLLGIIQNRNEQLDQAAGNTKESAPVEKLTEAFYDRESGDFVGASFDDFGMFVPKPGYKLSPMMEEQNNSINQAAEDAA